MRTCRIIVSIVGCIFCTILHGQDQAIRFRLVDASTQVPVSNAHVFLENTTFGAVSNADGYVELFIPGDMSEDLLITHVAYEVVVIRSGAYSEYIRDMVISLVPNAFEMPELVIRSGQSKKRRRQVKKFKKAFLGDDEIAGSCTIANPEVLRFDETGDGFKTTATDLIHVINPVLGYDVYYLLSQLIISGDGSTEYSGKALFKDRIKEGHAEQIKAWREAAYLSSPKYFFKSLIDDKLEENGFHVQMVRYENGRFIDHLPFDRDSLFRGPSTHGKYTLSFEHFLQVYNDKSRTVTYVRSGVRPGGLESARFSGSVREEKEIEHFEISQLFKIAPFVILDASGNVLNTKDVREYGTWATQKVAHQLPFDYRYRDLFEASQGAEPEDPHSRTSEDDDEKLQWLLSLLHETDELSRRSTISEIRTHWEDGLAPALVEILRLSTDRSLNDDIASLMGHIYSVNDSENYFDWIQRLWMWDMPNASYYFDFKAELYAHIDPRFRGYFEGRKGMSSIRLEEIVWGGVVQDGIPPLRNPRMVDPSQAGYLGNDDIVFGVFINGKPRAYPKRILAWHEFFTDTFGDLKIAGVYCTLCGTVIAYDMTHDGTFHDLGTSGFLYRSNKLMYDNATQSLWSTIEGQPVLGPLIGRNITLDTYPVVTTTWKAWLERHPDTVVLSPETGYDRDYSEGAAYRDYFATDRLMFPVLSLDRRLRNKEEVLIVRAREYRQDPLAVALPYLMKKRWHQDEIGNTRIVIVTDDSGAARAYDSKDIIFKKFHKGRLLDNEGVAWTVREDHLASDSGLRLLRLPSHNIFWFAWYNAYPGTRLVH